MQPAGSTEFAELFRQFTLWSLLVAAVVFVWLAYVLVRYRRRGDEPAPADAPRVGFFPRERGDLRLELAWTLLPTLLVAWLAYISLAPLDILWDVPADEQATVIRVEGSQWSWKFTYPNGNVSYDELRVVQGQKVKLNLTSRDVIHSFWISELGLKEDAVPGQYTELWFDTSDLAPGAYRIACAEYCGDDHSRMTATLMVEAA